MQIKFWGVRGSIAVPNQRMLRYGGNTSCVEVTLADGTEIILDAGTGIRELGQARTSQARTVRVLLTHLHLDHIQGLLFFPPLFSPTNQITVYGPPAPGPNLDRRLARYLSEPLSPIDLHELPARVEFAACPHPGCEIGGAVVETAIVAHRGVTLGYRITEGDATLCYLPDHEPALGAAVVGSDLPREVSEHDFVVQPGRCRFSAPQAGRYEVTDGRQILVRPAPGGQRRADPPVRARLGLGRLAAPARLAPPARRSRRRGRRRELGLEKLIVPWNGLSMARGSRPLRAIYLLEWGELQVTRLRGVAALQRFLTAALYRTALLEPAVSLTEYWERGAEILRRVPVWELRRPRDWRAIDWVMQPHLSSLQSSR